MKTEFRNFTYIKRLFCNLLEKFIGFSVLRFDHIQFCVKNILCEILCEKQLAQTLDHLAPFFKQEFIILHGYCCIYQISIRRFF